MERRLILRLSSLISNQNRKKNMLIECKNIEKTYGSGEAAIKAVDAVSLAIRSGESVALMGKSGSGKTTLLNVLGLIDQPDSGEYLFDTRDVLHLSARQLLDFRRHSVSVIFQHYNLLFELTAKENILLPWSFRRGKADPALFSDLVERLDLDSRLQHLPGQLSGGEQQRVAIARAILMDPVLILADEPTGNLDSQNSDQVSDLLLDCCKIYHKTLFMVTHDRDLAKKTDRIIYMQDGRIQVRE